MGRKPRPVPTATEMGELKDLWRKVLPRIEAELSREAAPAPPEAPRPQPPAGRGGKLAH